MRLLCWKRLCGEAPCYNSQQEGPLRLKSFLRDLTTGAKSFGKKGFQMGKYAGRELLWKHEGGKKWWAKADRPPLRVHYACFSPPLYFALVCFHSHCRMQASRWQKILVCTRVPHSHNVHFSNFLLFWQQQSFGFSNSGLSFFSCKVFSVFITSTTIQGILSHPCLVKKTSVFPFFLLFTLSSTWETWTQRKKWPVLFLVFLAFGPSPPPLQRGPPRGSIAWITCPAPPMCRLPSPTPATTMYVTTPVPTLCPWGTHSLQKRACAFSFLWANFLARMPW